MKNLLKVLIVFLSFVSIFETKELIASDEIEDIQAAILKQGANWTASENWVTRLTPEERRQLLGSFKTPAGNAAEKFISLPESADLPSTLDWRDNDGNWVTPVRDQARCGSCWGFSAIGQVEAWWKIQTADPDATIDLSEQYLLSCSEGDCQGWYVSSALDFIKDNSVCQEECFPYVEHSLPCDKICDNWQDDAVEIPGWGYITLEEAIVDNIKQGLLRHPVSVTYDVYSDFYAYLDGVYERTPTSTLQGGHAILVVGWNDSEQSWICKNSWGPTWGDDGYFRIKWGNCDIGTYTPFVWDSMISGMALDVFPEEINIETTTADSLFDEIITLSNSGPDILEYSLIDYEVPIAFHTTDFITYEDGFAWWCGDPEIFGYKDHWLQFLHTPLIDLSGTTTPTLNFMANWAVEDPAGATDPYDGWDGINVWVSTDGGQNYTVAIPTTPAYTCLSLWSFGEPEEGWDFGPGIPGWAGSSDGWTTVEFDLSSFISDSVIVRFALASDLAWSTIDEQGLFGLVLDDIKITDGANTLFFDSANDINSMTSTGFGLEEASWMEVTESVGSIAAYESKDVNLSFNTGELEPGNYLGAVTVTTNDSTTDALELYVNLTIHEVVSINEASNLSVDDWELAQNYPNPFNPVTRISYKLPFASDVNLTIYSITGELIRVIMDEFQLAGTHETKWDGKNSKGQLVSSGKYFYLLKAGDNKTLAKQMIMIK